jgi:hypothetical protein
VLRKGSAGSNTADDHVKLLDASIAALPPKYRRRLMVTVDGARASHGLVKQLDKLASRPGYHLIWSVGWELGERERQAIDQVTEQAWLIAVEHPGEIRERRAEGACDDRECAHRRCCIEEAQVAALTGILRGGRKDQLAAWPKAMRVFARRERPHPGAQLTLFEAADGWRYTLWATNLPEAARGWRGQPVYIDAAHRVHAGSRTGSAPGRTAGSASCHRPRWRSTRPGSPPRSPPPC